MAKATPQEEAPPPPPLTADMVFSRREEFVGGDLEIANRHDLRTRPKLYRGRIAEIADVGDEIQVKFEWLARYFRNGDFWRERKLVVETFRKGKQSGFHWNVEGETITCNCVDGFPPRTCVEFTLYPRTSDKLLRREIVRPKAFA